MQAASWIETCRPDRPFTVIGVWALPTALIGVRLRGWSYDPLRTKLATEKKVSLDTVHVVGAPDGTQAAWEREAAIAKGVEFTKQLITLPPNMLYPESFVALCEEAFELSSGRRCRESDVALRQPHRQQPLRRIRARQVGQKAKVFHQPHKKHPLVVAGDWPLQVAPEPRQQTAIENATFQKLLPKRLDLVGIGPRFSIDSLQLVLQIVAHELLHHINEPLRPQEDALG